MENIMSMSSTFSILSEPNRLSIIDMLIDGPQTVGEIVDRLEISQPQVSKHLKTLKEAGKVEVLVDAQKRIYSLEASKFKEISDVTMILPSEFYDDFDKWLRVGWALFNTSKNDYMFYTWMLFSSQSDKFDYNDIPLYYSDKYWGGFQSAQGKGFTAGSIIYWAREYWNKTAKSDDENKYLPLLWISHTLI